MKGKQQRLPLSGNYKSSIACIRTPFKMQMQYDSWPIFFIANIKLYSGNNNYLRNWCYYETI